ncbi:hypothetical protein V6N12_057597 [Hibiscus sabdariffa]|uniref:Uncharacterized protein n=1 Tax=Hibiscus sabdariffa TaxID=183260 RepID=A0ABR2C5K1_9ROSI
MGRGWKLEFKDATIDPLNQATLKKTPANSVPYQSEDSSECSSSKERKCDDVERTSLIAKEVDKDVGGSIEQEACVLKSQENEKATSEHEGGEKNLGLSQLNGEEEESKQCLGQKDIHHKAQVFEENLGPSMEEELVEVNPFEKEGSLNGVGNQETQKDLDTLNSFRELESRIPFKESKTRKRYGTKMEAIGNGIPTGDKLVLRGLMFHGYLGVKPE